MPFWGLYHILSDFGCIFFLYIRGVGRGVSIGTTRLLSVFQVIIISPRNARWAVLKGKAFKCIVPSIVLFWVLQILVNIVIFIPRLLPHSTPQPPAPSPGVALNRPRSDAGTWASFPALDSIFKSGSLVLQT
ncbi:unnamed protein product [Nyctereutes procyonoides]|uniref:Vomeronasal type-1 receptor n=1 Tax=Nyctereutes procyonoides TaxID=34880 RepID=A0A811YY70_NYCPR|nr:unnamed protein product [Nyctereutes procyonoides]